jgi:hypothetical protein
MEHKELTELITTIVNKILEEKEKENEKAKVPFTVIYDGDGYSIARGVSRVFDFEEKRIIILEQSSYHDSLDELINDLDF